MKINYLNINFNIFTKKKLLISPYSNKFIEEKSILFLKRPNYYYYLLLLMYYHLIYLLNLKLWCLYIYFSLL